MPHSLIRRTALVAVFVSLVAVAVSPAADADKPVKTVRLLTVGNSFSQNATKYLAQLTEAGGHKLIHLPAVIGGSSFDVHLAKHALHTKDPADPKGIYSAKGGLKEYLAAEPWDYITIQQASIKSHNPDTYKPFARELYEVIKAGSPKAEVLMHQTWAYRADDPRFKAATPKPGDPATREEMYKMLTAAYHTVARDIGVRVIPTGDAFHLADSDPTWGYKVDQKFEFKGAKKPALPDQTHSLHTGWRWSAKDGKESLGIDGHHANLAGEYLGGCVWYEVLFGESVVGNKFVPPNLDPAYAKFLQETAHKAVAAAPDTRKPAP